MRTPFICTRTGVVVFALLVAGYLLTGCTTDPVRMTHPTTGQTAVCGPYANTGIKAVAAARHEAQCIHDYQRQGYERAP